MDELLGLHYSIEHDSYNSMRDYVRSGGLTTILSLSPAHYKASLEAERHATPEMIFGTCFHDLMESEDKFNRKYCWSDQKFDRRTKEGKAAYQAFQDANQGKQLIDCDDREALLKMRDQVHNHSFASLLLSRGGKAEASGFWRDQETGVLCKCRPDLLLEDDRIVIDFKTIAYGKANESSFRRRILDSGYHIQSQFYLEGLSTITGQEYKNFIHIVVEKLPPYAVAVYALDDASLERAAIDIRKGLALIAECQKTGEWPDYSKDIQTISIPSWGFVEG